jgi:hypothetical protein
MKSKKSNKKIEKKNQEKKERWENYNYSHGIKSINCYGRENGEIHSKIGESQ